MKPNPILEEAWRVKDEMAREADDDLHRLCKNTRQWTARELQRANDSALLFKDESARPKS